MHRTKLVVKTIHVIDNSSSYILCIKDALEVTEITSERHMHTKSWCGHEGVSDNAISIIFPVWFQ